MMGNKDSTPQKRDLPATINDLEAILKTTTLLPWRWSKEDMPIKTKVTDYHQVYKNIYISSAPFAKSVETLQQVGITHVLNCAEGCWFMSVDTNEDYYIHCGIKYKGLKATDSFTYDLSQHFDEATEFIDQSLNSNGMSARLALKTIRSKRELRPNHGFLELICKLDKELYDKEMKLKKQQAENQEQSGTEANVAAEGI